MAIDAYTVCYFEPYACVTASESMVQHLMPQSIDFTATH